MADGNPETGRSLYTSGADYSSALSQSSYAANSARAPAAAPDRQQPVPGVTSSPRAAPAAAPAPAGAADDAYSYYSYTGRDAPAAAPAVAGVVFADAPAAAATSLAPEVLPSERDSLPPAPDDDAYSYYGEYDDESKTYDYAPPPAAAPPAAAPTAAPTMERRGSRPVAVARPAGAPAPVAPPAAAPAPAAPAPAPAPAPPAAAPAPAAPAASDGDDAAPAPPVAAPAPARPINSDTDDDEFAGPPCCVCLRARRDHAFLPCGHRCVCGPCGRMVSRREGPRCPMCRARIQSVQQIYT